MIMKRSLNPVCNETQETATASTNFAHQGSRSLSNNSCTGHEHSQTFPTQYRSVAAAIASLIYYCIKLVGR